MSFVPTVEFLSYKTLKEVPPIFAAIFAVMWQLLEKYSLQDRQNTLTNYLSQNNIDLLIDRQSSIPGTANVSLSIETSGLNNTEGLKVWADFEKNTKSFWSEDILILSDKLLHYPDLNLELRELHFRIHHSTFDSDQLIQQLFENLKAGKLAKIETEELIAAVPLLKSTIEEADDLEFRSKKIDDGDVFITEKRGQLIMAYAKKLVDLNPSFGAWHHMDRAIKYQVIKFMQAKYLQLFTDSQTNEQLQGALKYIPEYIQIGQNFIDKNQLFKDWAEELKQNLPLR